MALDILVPYWGDPALLRRTVESVLAQTDDEWTLLVLDDAYPDLAARDYLESIDDPRVRYQRNVVNVGITENYRLCLAQASADLVVFLGCDDVMHPSYVATVTGAAARYPQVSVIQPGVQVIDENDAPAGTLVDFVKQRTLQPRTTKPRLLAGEATVATLMHGDWLYWPSLTFRRRALLETGFRDDLPLVQDLAIVVDILMRGEALLFVPDICFSYRRHASSASSASLFDGRRFEGERRYFAMVADEARKLGWTRAARAARWHLTSRAHAASLVPGALRQRNRIALRTLVRHVVARSTHGAP